MAIKVTNTEAKRPEGGLHSAAFRSNGLVFTSGNTGVDYATGEMPEALEKQVINAIENLKTTLEASHSGIDKVLKVLLFISDESYITTVNRIYATYFKHKPARSCIVCKFPNQKLKVELECVAAEGNKSKL